MTAQILHAWDANGCPMTENAAPAPLDTLALFPHQAVISNDRPHAYGTIWLLADGTRYADLGRWIDSAEVQAGKGFGLLGLPLPRNTGRCPPLPGRGILLLAHDGEAHRDVLTGLTGLFRLFQQPIDHRRARPVPVIRNRMAS